jgi:hypothetical protein
LDQSGLDEPGLDQSGLDQSGLDQSNLERRSSATMALEPEKLTSTAMNWFAGVGLPVL